MTPDQEAIRTAIIENREQPGGRPRNNRAEQIVETAERLGDEGMVTEALLNLVDAYEYSSESDKMLVPFARLLQRYDAHPEYFDEYDVHTLFWNFKWVSGSMVFQPGVSLESIEHWLREMRERYRQAGHSLDAVHKSELRLAMHVGDDDRADRVHRLWLDTERDKLSDCFACDLVTKGRYHRQRDDDAAALETWRPVLDGEQGCKEQPHDVLGASLLPLLRLGRTEEARANHLRGYRLVRGQESLLGTVGAHIEFCALTGNEARGLEILAEHARFLEGVFDAGAGADLQTGTAVLLRRLIDLGLGAQQVPGPNGRTWTAAELLPELTTRIAAVDARFDARNGNTVVSQRTRKRLERKPFDPVRLGTSSAALPVATAAPAPVAVPAPVDGTDLAALIAEAEALDERVHPGAAALWRRVGQLARSQDRELSAAATAKVHYSRLATGEITDPAAQLDHLREAVELFTRAGLDAEAQRCRIREAFVLVQLGEDEAAGNRRDDALARLGELYEQGRATARQWLGGRVQAVRFTIGHAGRDATSPEVFAPFDAELAELAEAAATHPEADSLRAVRAYALQYRANLAGIRGEFEPMIPMLHDSLRLLREAGRDWDLREPSVTLVQALLNTGDGEQAQRVAEAALATEDPDPEPYVNAQLHWQLAQLLLSQNQFEGTLSHALSAGHWYEADGNDAAAAFNNYLAARAQLGLGRPFEAATILETALPVLERHEEPSAVDARFRLIDALSSIDEHRAAAEHALTGIEAVKDKPDLAEAHARYAGAAARSLEADGKAVQAIPVYLAASRLWRDLGEWTIVSHLVRTRAILRTNVGAYASARDELTELAAELATVLDKVEPQHRDLIRREQALVTQALAYAYSLYLDQEQDTDRQHRRQVVDQAREAITALDALGPGFLHDRFNVERQLVFYLAEAGDGPAAVAHARDCERRCHDAGAEFTPRAEDFANLAQQFAG